MVEEDEFAGLVGRLYQSAVSGDVAWDGMIRNLVSAVGARTGWLILSPGDTGKPRILGGVGAPAEAIDSYSDHYWAKDPWLRGVLSLSPGEVFASHAHIDDAAFTRTEIFADYVRPFFGDTTWCLAATVPVAGGAVATVGLHRLRGAGAFSDPEKTRLVRLIPHLRQALILRDRVGGLLAERDRALDLLAAVRAAAVVLDGDGQVRFVSPEAALLLASGAAVRLGRSGLVAVARQSQRALDQAVAQAAAGFGTGTMLRLSRGPEATPLVVLVAPYRPNGLGRGEVLCVFSDPDADVSPSEQHLMEAFGLTRAEARLAKELVRGARVAEVAARQGVSHATVRTQLSAVLAKTGCARQADLVGLLVTLPRARAE